MNELVQPEQEVNIIPRDYKLANKGSVSEISDKWFSVEMKYATSGLKEKEICEFFSQTGNGMLFFESFIKKIDGNTLFIENPIKHKFLQRRKFTRIKFIENFKLEYEKTVHNVTSYDISAGGMKLKTKENVNIEYDYKTTIHLSEDQEISCKFQPIRIQKDNDGFYTISGRFKNLSNVDKMTLIQFCMKKNMENVNK